MKSKEQVLTDNIKCGLGDNIKGVKHHEIMNAMQEYADQQNSKLKEAFIALLHIYREPFSSDPTCDIFIRDKWLSKAGLD